MVGVIRMMMMMMMMMMVMVMVMVMIPRALLISRDDIYCTVQNLNKMTR